MMPYVKKFAPWVIVGVLVAAGLLLFEQRGQRTPVRDITFSELLTQIDQGRVHDVTIAGNEITGHFSDNRSFITYAPNDPTLVQRSPRRMCAISARPSSGRQQLAG